MNSYTTRRIEILALTAIFVAQAAPAFAGEGGEVFPWTHWLVSMVNFAIFFGVLVKYAGPKVQEHFANRANTLRSDIEEAKRLRIEAQARLEEYSAKLEKLDDERKALFDQYHEAGEREKAKIVDDAKRQVDKMKTDADILIQQEVRKAVAAIEQQAVDLAVNMARTSLQAKLDDRVQNTLVDQFVTDLKAMES